MVRAELHGRRVGGWVLALGVAAKPGVDLRPIKKVRGHGPTAEVIDLAEWAANRWVGRVGRLLAAASPDRAVTDLPRAAVGVTPPSSATIATGAATSEPEWLQRPLALLRYPPTADRFELARQAADRGNALLLVPTVAEARRLAGRLRRAGLPVALMPDEWAVAASGATVVGTRRAAWAPVVDLAAVVVFDEHEPAYKEQAAPTWHARDVVIERARRAGAPCLLVSPVPSVAALAFAPLVELSRSEERAGWPVVEVVDRRDRDPARSGLFSAELTRHLRSAERVVCVLNRKGRSRLLACVACGALARCASCSGAMTQPSGELVCGRCGRERPVVCADCGGELFKNLRMGVSRAREELEALVGEPVDDVTGSTVEPPRRRVVIGTEAALHRVDVADVVAFLDFDQEILASRFDADEAAIALLARAARLVRGRGTRAAGRLLIQTRHPGHEVVRAVVKADPGIVAAAELRRRKLLSYPPITAMAKISGEAAPTYIERLGQPLGIEVLGPLDGAYLVRADDHRSLSDALTEVERPSGRLRIDVDPLAI